MQKNEKKLNDSLVITTENFFNIHLLPTYTVFSGKPTRPLLPQEFQQLHQCLQQLSNQHKIPIIANIRYLENVTPCNFMEKIKYIIKLIKNSLGKISYPENGWGDHMDSYKILSQDNIKDKDCYLYYNDSYLYYPTGEQPLLLHRKMNQGGQTDDIDTVLERKSSYLIDWMGGIKEQDIKDKNITMLMPDEDFLNGNDGNKVILNGSPLITRICADVPFSLQDKQYSNHILLIQSDSYQVGGSDIVKTVPPYFPNEFTLLNNDLGLHIKSAASLIFVSTRGDKDEEDIVDISKDQPQKKLIINQVGAIYKKGQDNFDKQTELKNILEQNNIIEYSTYNLALNQ